MKKKFLAIVIWLMWSAVSCRKLTDEENFLRVRDCGTVHLPTPNSSNLKVPDDSWLIEVSSPGTQDMTRQSFGSLISPYHILTSSQPVIFVNGADWSSNAKVKCSNNENIKAPDNNVLNSIKLAEMSCNECIKELLVIGCDPILKLKHAPLILTLKEPVIDRAFPCLAHNGTEVKVGEEVDSYGISFETKKLYNEEKIYRVHRHRNVTGITDKFVNTDVNPQQGYEEYGGPLLKMVDGKSTIIGISNLIDKTEKKEMFFDLRQYEPLLCEKFGICQKTVAPTTTAPPTPPPTFPTINRFDKDGTIWEEKEEEIRQEFDGQFKDIEQGGVDYSDEGYEMDFGYEKELDERRNRQEKESSGVEKFKWNGTVFLIFWLTHIF